MWEKMIKKIKYYLKLTILFASLFFLVWGYSLYIDIGEFNLNYSYLGCIVIILIGTGIFLTVPDVDNFLVYLKRALVYITPYLLITVISLAIWIFNFTSIRQMIAGFFQPVYILLITFAMCFMAFFLREKLVGYLFWGMTFVFGMAMIEQIQEVGISEFGYELYVMITSWASETLPSMKSLENMGLAHCYALFLTYFLLKMKKGNRIRMIIKLVACLFCFLVGFKRSSIIAVTVGVICGIVLRRLKKKEQKKLFVNCIIGIFVFFAIAYVPFIKYGVFDKVVDFMNINTSHRNEVYDIYSEYYEYNPTYFGRGIGWVQRNMIDNRGNDVLLTSYDTHNEYMKYYIELGFWGYLVWIVAYFPWISKKLITYQNKEQDSIVLGEMVIMVLLFVTEPLFFSFPLPLVLSAILLETGTIENKKNRVACIETKGD